MLYDITRLPLENGAISARNVLGAGGVRKMRSEAKNAPIYDPGARLRQEEQLIAWLRSTVKGLVQYFNEVVGDDVLYYTECTCFWFLYGRPTEYDADKLLANGLLTVESLSRLVSRLQKEMEIEV